MRCVVLLLSLCMLLADAVADLASTTGATNSDPRILTNSAALRSSSPQPASTDGMIQRLDQIRKAMDPVKVNFLSPQRVELLTAMLGRATNTLEKINLRYTS